MLRLHFVGVSSDLSFYTNPANAYRIEGESITDSHRETIAVRHGDTWEAHGQFYTRIECAGPLFVVFAAAVGDTAIAAGKFENVIIANGTILGGSDCVAKLDQDGQWRNHKTGEPAPAVVLAKF